MLYINLRGEARSSRTGGGLIIVGRRLGGGLGVGSENILLWHNDEQYSCFHVFPEVIVMRYHATRMHTDGLQWHTTLYISIIFVLHVGV